MGIWKHFIYKNIDSLTHNLQIVNFESNSTEKVFGLSRSVQKGDITKYRTSPNHYGTRYSDGLTFSISVKRQPDGAGRDLPFTTQQYRQVLAWLTSQKLPIELRMYNMSEQNTVCYFGLFTEVEPIIVDGKLYGMKFTFVCNSPFGYTPKQVYTVSGGSSIVINNISDERETNIYPVIEITPTATGTITITNETIGHSFSIKCVANNKVTIDCANMTIQDTAGIVSFSDLQIGLNDLTSLWTPELVYGNNTISVTGNATVNIECRYPLKVGDVV
jgi:phage-related protein